MIRNLAPLPRKLELEVVDTTKIGEEGKDKLELHIFPLSVEEDMKVTQNAEQYQIHDDDGPEARKMKAEKLKESGELLLYYAIKKSLKYSGDEKDWTDEQIKDWASTMPTEWQEKITREVYMWKGVDLFKVKKKEIERKLDEMSA